MSDAVWAVVPVKAFARAKSRLAPALSDAARATFARGLFEHVLDALAESRAVGGVLVATDAAEVAAAAHARGAIARLDAPDARSLADVVDGALGEVAARGAGAALVLMADLPRLQAGDVRALVALLAEHEVVAVRADDGLHTNALGLAPPARLATAFGRADSFAAHCAAARAAGLLLAIVENARVAFDVDRPADHARLLTGDAGR